MKSKVYKIGGDMYVAQNKSQLLAFLQDGVGHTQAEAKDLTRRSRVHRGHVTLIDLGANEFDVATTEIDKWFTAPCRINEL